MLFRGANPRAFCLDTNAMSYQLCDYKLIFNLCRFNLELSMQHSASFALTKIKHLISFMSSIGDSGIPGSIHSDYMQDPNEAIETNQPSTSLGYDFFSILPGRKDLNRQEKEKQSFQLLKLMGEIAGYVWGSLETQSGYQKGSTMDLNFKGAVSKQLENKISLLTNVFVALRFIVKRVSLVDAYQYRTEEQKGEEHEHTQGQALG